jgi:hypothetical protein
VNALERLIAQEAIDDNDPRYLELYGTCARRFEYESRCRPEIALEKRVDEPLYVLPGVGDISDGIERVGRSWLRTLVRLLIREQAQNLPRHFWKLTLKNSLAKVGSNVERLVPVQNSIDGIDRLRLANSHVYRFVTKFSVLVDEF